MNKIFFEFSAFKPARLMWADKAPAGPQATPEAEADKPKDQKPAAEKPGPKPAESAKKVVAARERGDIDSAVETANVDYKEIMAANQDKPEEAAKLLVESYLKLDEKSIKAIRSSWDPEVTKEEKDRLDLSLEDIGKKLDAGEFTPREIKILCEVLRDKKPDSKEDTKLKGLVIKTTERLQQLVEALKAQEQRIIFVRLDEIFKRHDVEYRKYLDSKDEDKFEAKKEFLKSITDDKEREIIEDAMDNPPTPQEQAYVRKFISPDDKRLSPNAIVERLRSKDKPMGYRESLVAMSLITDPDIAKFNQANDITPAQEAQIKLIRKTMEATKETSGSSIPENLKGMGIAGLIGELIKQLTKLIEQLGGQFKTMMGIEDVKPLETSPFVGGTGKFTISDYEEGKGVELTPAAGVSESVQAMADGVVTNTDTTKGTVTISYGTGKIIYGGLKGITVSENEKVTSNGTGKTAKPLGTLRGKTLTIQVLDDKDKEIKPTGLLTNFIEKPKAETPATPAATTPDATKATGEPKVDAAKKDAPTDAKAAGTKDATTPAKVDKQ